MKTHINLTVDSELYLTAKSKVENISEYVNSCLANLLSRDLSNRDETALKTELESYKNSIADLQIKKSIVEMELKTMMERELDKKLELKRREEFQRWLCPVCKYQNFMENARCGGCNLPTKLDTKTKIVFIDENKSEVVDDGVFD